MKNISLKILIISLSVFITQAVSSQTKNVSTTKISKVKKKLIHTDNTNKVKVALEVVMQFDFERPGNVAVSRDERIFATIHPLSNPKQQLVEIINNKAIPFPNAEMQKNGNKASNETFDTPLGISVDKKNRLWMIDMGLELGKTRLWCFDLTTNTVLMKIELPKEVAPEGSFIQDFAVDEIREWVYLADIANPGIIALNLKTKVASRFSEHPALQAENINMIIDGKIINFKGAPARVAINPITLSDDRETIFFGAMNGTVWFKVPAELFRNNAEYVAIGKAIKKFGNKPVSDGIATDQYGNHYITNLGEYSINKLDANGKLTTIIKDERLKFPDNVALSQQGYLYISVNQLNTTPIFTGTTDQGKPPYFIYRIKL